MTRPFPDLATLERELPGRPQPPVEGPGRPAAVMVCLSDEAVLLLLRASHPDDPWSGHVGLPGGRHDDTDPDLLATAIRETQEEVGLDVTRAGRVLGPLGELAGRGAGVRSIRIAAFVAALDARPALTLAPTEVSSAHWVPLGDLVETTAEVSELRHHVPAYLPAVAGGALTVWGITFGILGMLREVMP
jgi:8-oxo-dGTP pyrophosphatase MutT (NUDIX family)